MNYACDRRRCPRRYSAGAEEMEHVADPRTTPEQRASDAELQRVLLDAIDGLPEHFRTVFVLRAVQGLSIEETADSLDLNEDTVKTRLHRAKNLLQRAILVRS